MATILITGGSGFLGNELCNWFISQNHDVRILSRHHLEMKGVKSFLWNLEKDEIAESAFDGLDHLIHLAGANIGEKRWTEKRKKEIINSRIKGISLIEKVLKKKKHKLKSFIGASAVGFYGMNNSDKPFFETDSGTTDFLSETCIKWEQDYEKMTEITERLCIIRLGVILDKKGGLIKRLLPIFQFGLGSAVGTGKQYLPWIDIEDTVRLINWLLFSTEKVGIYNAVATEQINNKQFSQAFANSISKPFLMPNVPAVILTLMYGKMANMILKGPRVSNHKLLSDGFRFKYPSIQESLNKNKIA